MFGVSVVRVGKLSDVKPGNLVRFQDDPNWRLCFKYKSTYYLFDFAIRKGHRAVAFGTEELEKRKNDYSVILTEIDFRADFNSLSFFTALKHVNSPNLLIVGGDVAFLTFSPDGEGLIAVTREGQVIDQPDAPVAQFGTWEIRAGIAGDHRDIIYQWSAVK